MADGDNALSGGLLVILGIVVAVGLAVYFVPRMSSNNDQASVNIDLPDGKGSATITAPTSE